MEPISKSKSIIFMTKKVAVDMMNEKEDHERKSIEKCTQRDDWSNQKEAIDKDKNSCERVRFLDQ